MYNKNYNIILIFLLSLSFSYAQNDDMRQQLIKLNQIIKLAQEKHLTEAENKNYIDAAIKAVIQQLDPHSYYFTPEEVNLIEMERNGNFFGIGATFTMINDTATVLSVFKNGPAYSKGIRTGDKLISINNALIIGKKKYDIDQIINTNEAKLINIKYFPYQSNKIVNENIKTIHIPSYSVDASFMIEGTDIGYISVNRFMKTTHNELTDSLINLSNLGMRKLIIDLRGNPGGIIDETYLSLDEFISEGNIILMTKGRDPIYNETYKSSAGGKFEDLPMVLLVDKETASAPEIFAGAVQDLDRGLIIGENTFGKGLVQRPYQFFDGSELWLTVAQYYTPSGRSIQRPYEKNEKYGTLQDRIVLKDGLNLGHSNEVVAGYNNTTTNFRTRTGRPVIGNGGITPDYIIYEDTLSNYSQQIISTKILDKFAINYYKRFENEFKTFYSNDFESYLRNFDFDDQSLCDLVNYSAINHLPFDYENISGDINHIKTLLKAKIASLIWDEVKMKKVLLDNSKHLKKAIELMPVAEQILHKK